MEKGKNQTPHFVITTYSLIQMKLHTSNKMITQFKLLTTRSFSMIFNHTILNHGTPINIGHVNGQNDCINILSATPVSYLINVTLFNG